MLLAQVSNHDFYVDDYAQNTGAAFKFSRQIHKAPETSHPIGLRIHLPLRWGTKLIDSIFFVDQISIETSFAVVALDL